MTLTIHRLDHETPEIIAGLTDLLRDCVAAGASVGFMHALDPGDARIFWRASLAAALARERTLMIARCDNRIVGTAQMIPATMPNQPHRADIAKVLVSPDTRRKGVGAALMQACEVEARRQGRWLLTLDTVMGSAGEALYASLGWQRAGPVPDYALMPDGSLCTTMFMWKRLT